MIASSTIEAAEFTSLGFSDRTIATIQTTNTSYKLSSVNFAKVAKTMATQAHCAYCFESLAAALEKRVPLSLSQTQALWKQYHADPSEEPPTEVDEVEEPSDSELEDPAASTLASTDPSYRPAAISRLLAPSPGSASSSSVQSTSSTPSGISEASSATSVSSKSPSSSRSSFFSLGKRLRSPKDEGQKENAHPSRRPGAAADAGDEEIANHPLFVTWNVLQKNGDKRLRGEAV